MTIEERSQLDDFVELRRIINSVVSAWWLLLLVPLIMGAAGYWLSKQQPTVYQATTSIIVGRSIQSANLDSRDILTSQQLALTYADIARRQPVLQGTIDALGLETGWRELKQRVHVDQVEGTQLLEIVVEANSPDEARQIADEVAHQLILVSPTTLQNREAEETRAFVRERLGKLEERIKTSQERLDEVEATMTAAQTSEEVRALQEDFLTQQTLLANLEANYAQLLAFMNSEQPVNYLAVVEPAQAGNSPVRPRVQLNVMVAVVVGLALAVGIVLLVDFVDDRVKTLDELRGHFGLVPLGIVTKMKPRAEPLVTANDANSPTSEAFRMIRTNIRLLASHSPGMPGKIITITSALPQEGKSLIAANLGVVMSQAGLKTVIVDADLRNSQQHKIFQVSNQSGLTNALMSSEVNLTETEFENLLLLPAGTSLPSPSELISTHRMGRLLAWLVQKHDIVIIDATPLLSTSEAVVLSSKADGVVLVVRAGMTRKGEIAQALLTLQQAQANVWGTVLNGVSVMPRGLRTRRRFWLPFGTRFGIPAIYETMERRSANPSLRPK